MSVINTNVKALVATESMRSNNLKLSTAMERLSTGLRINGAKDDAAGLAISNRMTAQIRGMSMAIKNANDGISMAQTADGAYGQVTSMLQRMRELAVQAANGAASSSDRESIQLEIQELKAEINNVADRTNFNGIKLLDGTARDVKLQTGTNEGELMSVGFNSVKTKDIGSGDAPALTSVGGADSTFAAFTAGDLVINGVAVGASLATDDNLSKFGEKQTITFSGSATTAGAFTVALTGLNGAIQIAQAAAQNRAAADEASAFMTAVNAQSTTSGITATVSGAVVTLSFDESLGDAAAATIVYSVAVFATNQVILSNNGTPDAEVAASAIAKVAAINRVSEQSGVNAKVNDTRAIGSTMTAAALTGTVSINGHQTASFTTTTDTSTSRKIVVDAVNAISAATGVRAVDTGDDSKGVELIAADGRNIKLALNTVTSAATGLSPSGTYVGTYSLYSNTGGAITIDHQTGRTMAQFDRTGLGRGTFEAGQARVTSSMRATVTADPSTSSGAGVLNSTTLVINDIAIAAARDLDDTASYVQTGSLRKASAIAISAAINRDTALHGVTATAQANVIRGTGFTASSITTGEVHLNGVNININASSRENVLESINVMSGQTGVVAREHGDGIELVAADGRNISIGLTTLTAANVGLTGVTIAASASAPNTYYASVGLSSDKAFKVERGSEGGVASSNFSLLGFREGTFGGNSTGMKVAEVDVSTQLGAGMAITAIDSAIGDVASAQARSGAFQNRLDAAVNVLSESSENMSASRSRILDTDYAQETTALAKAQIVQQAATAMLAQANQQSQSVLALLQ